MVARKNTSGAKFTRKLSEKELKTLCGQRGTTGNNYSSLSHSDVMKAAKKIGRAPFDRWMSDGGKN
jgi:hypothetical protein